MKFTTLFIGTCLASSLASCLVSPVDTPARESISAAPTQSDPWRSGRDQRNLYARDGSPVPNQPAASVTTADGIGRELGQGEGSRPYLLELYQQTIEQKEELALEVSALHAALEEADHRQLELQTENEGMQMRLNELEHKLDLLEADKLDLAGRLATAQIRRLEAEKLLLETTLEWTQFQAARAAAVEEASVGDAGEQ